MRTGLGLGMVQSEPNLKLRRRLFVGTFGTEEFSLISAVEMRRQKPGAARDHHDEKTWLKLKQLGKEDK